jgi:integrase
MKTNAANERIKHEYFTYLREAKQLSVHSVDAVAKALDRFESYIRYRDFGRFHREQAVAFKKHMADQLNARTRERLSKATIYSTLAALKSFFFWLARQRGYKSKLQYADADFFNMSLKDTAIAKSVREPRVPTIGQIRTVLAAMPNETPIDKRNRALLAFTLLTGARDNAIASMRLKHVDLAEGVVHHDAREMRTKFSKSFPTYFFEVGDDIRQIVVDWIKFLQDELRYGPDDPLFPATQTGLTKNGVPSPIALSRECWATAAPIRAIFKAAFESAGLPYFNPHSLRKTLVRFGMESCHGCPDVFKAWSQNLGHDEILTTFRSYGDIPAHRQRDLIRSAAPTANDDRLALELGRQALATLRAKKMA